MARVIKGNQTSQNAPRRPALPTLMVGGGKKVIEKDVYRAQQDAAGVIAQAEDERERLLTKAKAKAAQAREEAQAEGAQEAFEQAAAEALEAFRHRAERYGEAADDIRVLAFEVARKILGAPLALPQAEVDRQIAAGMAKLRARRKLRIQVPEDRQAALLRDRPKLMARLDSEPDLVIEAADDVSAGRARIVTEIGAALCSEQAALDSLAEALDVEESATAPSPSAVIRLSPGERDHLAGPFVEEGGVFGMEVGDDGGPDPDAPSADGFGDRTFKNEDAEAANPAGGAGSEEEADDDVSRVGRALGHGHEDVHVEETARSSRPPDAPSTGRSTPDAFDDFDDDDDDEPEERTEFLANPSSIRRSVSQMSTGESTGEGGRVHRAPTAQGGQGSDGGRPRSTPAPGRASPERARAAPAARPPGGDDAAAREQRRGQNAHRASDVKQAPRKKGEFEPTLALDVSALRSELGEPPSDELDLFADDAVLE